MEHVVGVTKKATLQLSLLKSRRTSGTKARARVAKEKTPKAAKEKVARAKARLISKINGGEARKLRSPRHRAKEESQVSLQAYITLVR